MAILPQRLAVIGAGQMGAGIAQVVASSGIAVKLVDQSHQALDKALAGIESSLARLVTKGRVDAVTAEAALGRLYTSTSLEVGGMGWAGQVPGRLAWGNASGHPFPVQTWGPRPHP